MTSLAAFPSIAYCTYYYLSPCACRVVDISTEMGNRVIRKFTIDDEVCSFLRLQIGDESGSQMYGNRVVRKYSNHDDFDDIEWDSYQRSPLCFLAYSPSRKYICEISYKYRTVKKAASNPFFFYFTELKECPLWMVYSNRPPLDLRDSLAISLLVKQLPNGLQQLTVQ